jgi:hypothetical protein
MATSPSNSRQPDDLHTASLARFSDKEYTMEFGILGLIILIIDIVAIMKFLGSSASPGMNFLWTLLILFLPVIGLIIWWLAGPK